MNKKVRLGWFVGVLWFIESVFFKLKLVLFSKLFCLGIYYEFLGLIKNIFYV